MRFISSRTRHAPRQALEEVPAKLAHTVDSTEFDQVDPEVSSERRSISRRSSASGRRLAFLASLISLVSFVACRDYFTSPSGHQSPITLRPGSVARTTLYPDETPPSITVPIAINDTDGSGGTDTGFVPPWIRHTTVMKAAVGGLVTRTPNFAGLGSATSYDPIGATDLTWHDGHNTFVLSPFSSSDTIYVLFDANSRVDGGVWTSYGIENELNFVPPGQTQPITCGPQYHAPLCANFSGSATIMLTRLESSLSLVVDSTSVVPGSVVHFSALANPAVVQGQTIPVEVDSSTWIPDPASQGGEPSDTTPCFFGLRGNACTRTIVGSGTLSVVAYINGKRQVGSVHVATPSLTLTASSQVVTAGTNVTFTPTWSDGHPTAPDMWSWIWVPDQSPGHTNCNFWEDPCTKPVQESGTMKVQVKRNGVFRYATVRVVVSCLTTDPILNTYGVRVGLMNMLNQSGPTLPPGDGIANGDSVGNKREHGGYIYKTSGGTYYFEPDSGVFANECGFQSGNPNTRKHNPADSVVAHAHSHPTLNGLPVYGCPPTAVGPGAQMLLSRGPWDTSRPIPRKDPDINTGGGSLYGDWVQVMGTRDEYVMNANGEVWNLPSYLSFPEQAGNRKFWKISGNSNSTCDWHS